MKVLLVDILIIACTVGLEPNLHRRLATEIRNEHKRMIRILGKNEKVSAEKLRENQNKGL